MTKHTYFDARGRPFTDEHIAREYFGRNREAAMQMLQSDPRSRPRAPVPVKVEEVDVDGELHVRVSAAPVDPSRDE